MGDGGMTRGDTTTSWGGQETTTPEKERGATRDSSVKRDGGMVGRGALAWRQWRISGGGGSGQGNNNNVTIKWDTCR